MAVTRLERKGRRNISKAKNRVIKIKRLNAVPTIKNVDIEEIKKSFAAKSAPEAGKKEKAEPKIEAPAAPVEATTEEAPKAEKPKKATKKKDPEA